MSKVGSLFHNVMASLGLGINNVDRSSDKRKMHRFYFYCCTVHLDNIKITFTNECTFYLTYKMLKFTIKTSIHSPLNMFRSNWTIFRELMVIFAKVTLLQNYQ
jgi:hypothetical protein